MKTNQPSNPYPFEDFKHAQTNLLEGIERSEPYALVLGPSGIGKTTLIRELHTQIDPRSVLFVYLSDSKLSRWQLICHLAHALHLPIRYTRDELRTLLIDQLQRMPTRLILVLDDAHLLSDDLLHALRQLVEARLNNPPLFHVLFASLPEFKERLRAPHLAPFHRRLWPRVELNGLRHEELAGFIAYLSSPEQAERFSEQTILSLFEQTAGITALFERAVRACLQAYSEGPITVEQINDISDQLELL